MSRRTGHNTVRVSDAALKAAKALSERYGVPQAAIVKAAILDLYERANSGEIVLREERADYNLKKEP